MKILFKGLNVFSCGAFVKSDILLTDGIVSLISENITEDHDVCYDLDGKFAFPGFTDVHVHFREPGFSYKETIKSGSMAAAKGGYTAVCTRPNLKPVPDTKENILVQINKIKEVAYSCNNYMAASFMVY